MFKGRSINEVVESVYDSFYEALTEGKDVTLLQTDFCKTYVCGHGWGKEQEQRHKPKESEEKCLLVTRNTKGGTNECDIRWEKGESKTNQKEEKDKKEDKSV